MASVGTTALIGNGIFSVTSPIFSAIGRNVLVTEGTTQLIGEKIFNPNGTPTLEGPMPLTIDFDRTAVGPTNPAKGSIPLANFVGVTGIVTVLLIPPVVMVKVLVDGVVGVLRDSIMLLGGCLVDVGVRVGAKNDAVRDIGLVLGAGMLIMLVIGVPLPFIPCFANSEADNPRLEGAAGEGGAIIGAGFGAGVKVMLLTGVPLAIRLGDEAVILLIGVPLATRLVADQERVGLGFGTEGAG